MLFFKFLFFFYFGYVFMCDKGTVYIGHDEQIEY